MKINIVNISDFPANISLDEKDKGLSFLRNNNFESITYFEDSKKLNISKIDELLKKDIKEIILFSSGGFDAINNINAIGNIIGKGTKILIGFSDILHLQAKFYDKENIFNIYGLTLRNIYELNSKNKVIFLNLINRQVFETELQSNSINKLNISGRLHGGHLMIFMNILDIYGIEIINGDILYLEFHGMEDYFIKYYLDVLKNKGVFNKISGIILDKEIDNFNKQDLIKYFSTNKVDNIYSLADINFLPFYKKVEINNGKLFLR